MEIESFLVETISNIAFRVYPLIGRGQEVKSEIDYIATECWSNAIKKLSMVTGYDVQAISVEGERDGIKTGRLQKDFEISNRALPIALDPIDGTTAGATGSSRCITAIGLSLTPNAAYKIIPDNISCFYMASNSDCDFVEEFNLTLPKSVSSDDKLATIHRKDTSILFEQALGGKKLYTLAIQDGYQGESGYYLPSYMMKDVFIAGDTSIPLFFECEHFMGRTGASEARLESRLWKYWKGFLVSSSIMKKDPINYINNRLNLIKSPPKKWDASSFFEDHELEKLYKYGWTDEEILAHYSADSFSPDFDLILIGSLTGTKDSRLPEHSMFNLEKIKFNQRKKTMEMEILVIKKNGKKKLTVPVKRSDSFEL